MDEKITFRTEIEFKGSLSEFEKVATSLAEQPIRIRVEWPPDHTAGCWPIGPEQLLDKKVLEKVTEGMPRIKIIKGIPGGIRDPHLHIGANRSRKVQGGRGTGSNGVGGKIGRESGL